jgi:hypothetical protein
MSANTSRSRENGPLPRQRQPGYQSHALWIPDRASSIVNLVNDEAASITGLLRQLLPAALEPEDQSPAAEQAGTLASGSQRISIVISMPSKSSIPMMIAVGRPFLVIIVRSCVSCADATIALRWLFASASDVVVGMTRIVVL